MIQLYKYEQRKREMNRKKVSRILLPLLLVGMLTLAFNIQEIEAPSTTWTVDDDGPADFHTIQEAISSMQVSDGDTIFVHNGTYNEETVVNKAVSLIGESTDAVIDGGVSVETDNVTIQGFMILAGPFQVGRSPLESRLFRNVEVADNVVNTDIHLYNTVNATVRKNTLTNGGIWVEAFPQSTIPFGNNTIAENSITNASTGIFVRSSRGNKITGNTLRSNDVGILVGGGADATISDNLVANGGVGIHLLSTNNTLAGNRMVDNLYNFGFGQYWAHPNCIDTSNTINGMPVYYLEDQSNIVLDSETYPDIGFLALINCVNVTVKDLTITRNGQGIPLEGGSNNTILNCKTLENVIGIWARTSMDEQNTHYSFIGNTVSHNGAGMWLVGSSRNKVTNNNFENNTRINVPSQVRFHYGELMQSYGWTSGALSLYASTSNTIVGNTMINSDEGIYLGSFSGNNTLRNNAITGNLHNFGVDHHARGLSYYVQDIDESNTVDGKPIIYWINHHNEQVPKNAGYVAIVNSTDIAIKFLNLSKNRQGILLVSSNDTVISSNRISNAACGMVITSSSELFPGPVYHSANDTVYNNTIIACGTAVCVYSGKGHTISSNYISGNIAGIYLKMPSSNAVVIANTITNCTYWGNQMIPHDAWLWDVGVYGPAGINIESSDNVIAGNTVSYNDIGMTIGLITMRGNNVIYHNNFVDNIYKHVMIGSLNIWDNGYPSGGNYWSDYTGMDIYGGPNQDERGSDGIGDSPFMLSEWIDPDVPPECRDQRDRYPLMKPWMPPTTFADLIRRKAWPKHNHYDISRDENKRQTLYATVKNLGNQTVWVKAVFNVTRDDGSSIVIESEPLLIEKEEILELSANFRPLTDKDVGRYSVSATCWYSHDGTVWAQGEKKKTFKFNVIS
jgi:parallel beta-helix repeat protein